MEFKKKHLFYVVLVILFTLSCTTDESTSEKEDGKEDNDPVIATLTGSINHSTYTTGEKAACEFNRIPKTYNKFIEMYEKAAIEPQGGAAMFILAMEIYKQDAVLGEKCMAHTIYSKHASIPDKLPGHQMKTIKDKLRGTDNYAQPYISMAFYEGATPTNKYIPERYKVNFYVKPGGEYGPLSSAQSYVIPLKVRAYGKDWNNNPNRDHNMSVVKPSGGNYYLVFEFMDLFISVLEPNK